jgi:hypothetical protein
LLTNAGQWVTFLITVTHTAAYGRAPTATIDGGVIAGTAKVVPSSTATVNQFLGVPFAALPARFEPPRKPQRWKKPLNASEYAPACIAPTPKKGDYSWWAKTIPKPFLNATFLGLSKLHDSIIKAYPLSSPGLGSPYDIIAIIYTDFLFQ